MHETYIYDIPSAVQGRRPWSGIPPENKKYIAQEKKYSKGDSPEQIGDCLWCWLTECVDCISAPRKEKDNPSPKPPRASGEKGNRLGGTQPHQAKRKKFSLSIKGGKEFVKDG